MPFVKIGDAEIDPKQVAGMVQSVDAYTGRPKVLLFLKSGQTVTTSINAPVKSLTELLGAAAKE